MAESWPLADDSTRARIWLAAFLAALLLHVLLFRAPFEWMIPAAPPRIDIQEIDPAKLDAIREQWKKQQKLLINKDTAPPSEAEAPKDARYMSDRNIRVEKEQRARDTSVIPQPGGPREQKEVTAPRERTDAKTLPKLGDLGLPFKLDKPAPKVATRPQPAQRKGGDQYVDEKLPEGARNLLNAQESVYYSFYARLYEAVGPIWQSEINSVSRRISEGEYITAVEVVVDESGDLVRVNQLRSSGIAEFDDAVERSWRRVGRFPNPPRGLLNEEGLVRMGWTFTVKVGGGFGFQFLPPERNY